MNTLPLARRIETFGDLGLILRDFVQGKTNRHTGVLQDALKQAEMENPWFTCRNIMYALGHLSSLITYENLALWMEPYLTCIDPVKPPKSVGVVMAGNIPLVGFNDYLSVLMSGMRLKAKLSAQDFRLLPAIHSVLAAIEPEWNERAEFTQERLCGFDAIIATGSNNTSRYFDYYFQKFPHIIRRTRTSAAILTGNEKGEELTGIANDALLYFGLGCRNVSRFFVPEGCTLKYLRPGFNGYLDYMDHPKFRNNFDYYRAVYAVHNNPFQVIGPAIFIDHSGWAPPVSVIYYTYYKSCEELMREVENAGEKIQCLVSAGTWPFPTVPPGKSQFPQLWDYADGIDTLRFLLQEI